jgi:hypothetical protein
VTHSILAEPDAFLDDLRLRVKNGTLLAVPEDSPGYETAQNTRDAILNDRVAIALIEAQEEFRFVQDKEGWLVEWTYGSRKFSQPVEVAARAEPEMKVVFLRGYDEANSPEVGVGAPIDLATRGDEVMGALVHELNHVANGPVELNTAAHLASEVRAYIVADPFGPIREIFHAELDGKVVAGGPNAREGTLWLGYLMTAEGSPYHGMQRYFRALRSDAELGAAMDQVFKKLGGYASWKIPTIPASESGDMAVLARLVSHGLKAENVGNLNNAFAG